MKNIVLAVSMLIASASVSFAQENTNVAILSSTSCPEGYESTPTYKWDSAQGKFVFVGYTCKKVYHGNH